MSKSPAENAKMPVEALRRGLEMVERLALSPEGLTLAEIADSMGLKASTAHNLLKTLYLCGFVDKEQRGRYVPGWKLRSLGRSGRYDLSSGGRIALLLKEIAEATQESVVLTTLLAGRRVVLARVQGAQMVSVNTEAQERNSRGFWAYVTARVLAAWASPKELDEIVAREGYPGLAWAGIDTREALAGHLEAIRSQQYAQDHTGQVSSLALAICAGEGVLGVLGLHLPSYRFSPSRREQLLGVLRAQLPLLAAAMGAGGGGVEF